MNAMKLGVVGITVMAFSAFTMPAQAAMVGTSQFVAAQAREANLAKVQTFMASELVQQKLVAWGVDSKMAAERVASLTEPELQTIALKIDQQQAGGDGGVLIVVGVVFVVLIILELVGVTHIFRRF